MSLEDKQEHFPEDTFVQCTKNLTAAEQCRLDAQDKRLVSEFKARKLETEAQRNWDIFYKRNETRFFKDRHWTSREFSELLGTQTTTKEVTNYKRNLLEVGCGVGNLIFPLLEEQCNDDDKNGFYFYACDFSPRAVDFVRAHPLYNEKNIKAFQSDITTQDIYVHIDAGSLDVCTLIFVLSAIHPEKFIAVIQNLWRLLKPGGVVLFRDYGRYDMAQLRFKPGNKISENLYVRQDGTRSYYFDTEELSILFNNNGFDVIENAFVHRRTLNIKEGIDVPRIFVQGKFKKRES